MPTNDTRKDSTSFMPPLLLFSQKSQLFIDLSFRVRGQVKKETGLTGTELS